MDDDRRINLRVDPATFKKWDDLRQKQGYKWQTIGTALLDEWYSGNIIIGVGREEPGDSEIAPAVVPNRPTTHPQPSNERLETDNSAIEFELGAEEQPWLDRLLYILRSGDTETIGAITRNLDRFDLLSRLLNREERASGDVDKLSAEIAANPERRVEFICELNKRYPARGKSIEKDESRIQRTSATHPLKARRRSGD